jgi:hypothetical protein
LDDPVPGPFESEVAIRLETCVPRTALVTVMVAPYSEALSGFCPVPREHTIDWTLFFDAPVRNPFSRLAWRDAAVGTTLLREADACAVVVLAPSVAERWPQKTRSDLLGS